MSLNRWKILACTLTVGVGGMVVFAQSPEKKPEVPTIPDVTVKPASPKDGAETLPPAGPAPDGKKVSPENKDDLIGGIQFELPLPAPKLPHAGPPKPAPNLDMALPPLPAVVPSKPSAPELSLPAVTLPELKPVDFKVPLPKTAPPPPTPAETKAPPAIEPPPTVRVPDLAPPPPLPKPSGADALAPTVRPLPIPPPSELTVPPPAFELPKPPPATTREVPPVAATGVVKDSGKLKMLLRMGDGQPRFEIRNAGSTELLFKAYGEKIEMQPSKEGKSSLAGVKAIGQVRFTAPGMEGSCDNLSILSSTGEVLLEGKIRLRTKHAKGWSELTADKMVYQIGGNGPTTTKTGLSDN